MFMPYMLNSANVLDKIDGAVAGYSLDRLQSDVVEYENLVENGDFSDGLNGWSVNSATDVIEDNGRLRIDTNLFRTATQLIENFDSGDVFFLKASTEREADAGSVFFTLRDGSVNVSNLIVQDSSLLFSTTYGLLTSTSAGNEIRVARNVSGDGFVWVDDILLIKMTGTRYENYTAEQMNETFSFTPTTSRAIVPQKPIRVFRDSDMAETDIGLISNKLDTVSLLAFADGASAFVAKWTDQTNNGNDAIQSVADNCPRIVNNGVLEVDDDGDVSIYFDGDNDFFDIVDNQGLDITDSGFTVASRFKPNVFLNYIISRNAGTFASIQYGLFLSSNSGAQLILKGGAITSDSNTNPESKLVVATYDKINVRQYLNSTLVDTVEFSEELINRFNTQVGCRSASVDGSIKGSFFNGYIGTIIVFNTALTDTEVASISNRI